MAEVIAFQLPDGERAVLVTPTIREDWSPELKDALALRREASLAGRCPHCGATWSWPNRDDRRRAARQRRALHVWMEHDAGCPATTEHVLALYERLRGGREEGEP